MSSSGIKTALRTRDTVGTSFQLLALRAVGSDALALHNGLHQTHAVFPVRQSEAIQLWGRAYAIFDTGDYNE